MTPNHSARDRKLRRTASCAGPPCAGQPNISLFRFPLPPFSLFLSLSLSGCLLVEFWWCFEAQVKLKDRRAKTECQVREEWGRSKPTLAKPTLAIVIRPTLARPTLAKPILAKTNFGQNRLWPKPTLAKPALAKPTLAKTDFGQNRLWPNRLWPNRLWPKLRF